MSIKCGQVVEYMNTIAPVDLAEEWDNVGLIIGDLEQYVCNVMVCLDVTTDVVNWAIKEKADMIISHHPLIFKSVKRIVYNDWKNKLIYKIIKNNISLYSAHTNLDYAKSGVNWTLARALKLDKIENAGYARKISYSNDSQAGEDCYTLAKTGVLKTPLKLAAFADYVKKCLNIDHIRLISRTDNLFNKDIRKIMVFAGSFDEDILRYISPEIDIIVTGDIKYHTAMEMLERGIYAIDAGHFATENIIVPVISEILKKKFPNINIMIKKETKQPFIYC